MNLKQNNKNTLQNAKVQKAKCFSPNIVIRIPSKISITPFGEKCNTFVNFLTKGGL